MDTTTSCCKVDTWISKDGWERVGEEVGEHVKGNRTEAREHESHNG